ncbi:shikimate dehydrogenase (NADP(+)) [Candidatus Phycosocius spiralis]|uniref:Shikimate dehydrogenase (NADP(+)) n=2 Tax=Candidatus Phycosocius spiralis TaxID=2815099 RepID=A0ABQ4PUI1_9PROT|nr:shikimate dehydrogenase (NADP(+)) [Candidatus Phycosocius spiralis]
MIKASTALYGVLGHPVRHSLSPILHNAWIESHGFDAAYVALEIAPERFEVALAGLAASDFRGLNVTTPFKERAAAASSTQSEIVARIKAANCLTLKTGQVHGDNTDGAGLVADLDARAPDWRDLDGPVIVLGSGGAARSILSALTTILKRPIIVINRDQVRAEETAQAFQPYPIQIGSWADLPSFLAGASLVINATSQGLNGLSPFSPDFAQLAPEAIIYDTIYAPAKTAFIEAAEAVKRRSFNGIGMLVGQGALSFEIWFGVRPDLHSGLTTLEGAMKL